MNNFCSSCGSNLNGGANCPNCGAPVMMQPVDNNVQTTYVNNQQVVDDGFVNKKAKNAIILEIISFFIFGFLSYVGIFLAVQALKDAEMHNGKDKKLAITGIILGTVLAIFYTLNLILSFS